MLHDVLLSCLSLSCKGIGIKDFLSSKVVDVFLHPCERKIFTDILNILNYLNEIVRFAKYFGGVSNNITDFDEAEEFAAGFYLRNFANGIESALEDYYNEITLLEAFIMKNKPHSLIHIYNVLEKQLPCILFLRKLINDAKIQKLNGCKLLQSLYQNYDNGDYRIEQILLKVSKPVKLAFFSHLSHWMLFGVVDDEYAEFFITYRSTNENAVNNSSLTSSTHLTSVSEEEIWQYEINLNQLPSFVSSVLAEKVLFVGQTALIFKMDRSKQQNYKWSIKSQSSYCDAISELWDGKEAVFCKMIEDLHQEDMIDVFQLENVINQIKKHVSQRLSAIANVEDDLNRQMCLIKDFYLLGRGEFYMEFYRQLTENSESHLESTANYTRSFEIASNVMGISDDLENFSLSVIKTSIDLDETCEFENFQNLHLKYIYKWPLNLLFSPTTVERYNTVFRFLLIVRKLQYDLELVWANHKWAGKTPNPVNAKIMHFRNHLMFFLNNLQYYIQVDVLECQFSILMNVIKSKADFEEIQRAHSVFLANVLSQCFLLTDATDKKLNTTQSTCNSQYPVYGTFLEIFNVCEKFCLLHSGQNLPDGALKECDRLEERFNVSILGLIKLLNNLRSASSFGPLSQLLLRLDYNRWFSAEKKKANESS
ncbi:gamma-tubulin complex component 4 homolog [Drosophila grimshawi]|uniref:Gamma-tubulin complex component n=1 Tax=Drosophila grimshawi TaxID=7222 RepID=B4JQ07_DROGR|nr:gamma-tubulin complex component 4 homolog [Drosophila grimshawi]EDV98987.1 GH13619 [Drosophila grimshawi]